MEEIRELKIELEKAFLALPEKRKTELKEFYSNSSDQAFIAGIGRDTKEDAQNVIDYADRHCYGYGEVGYNLDECVKDFAENVPELQREYERLLYAYFDFLTESKEI